MKELAAVDHELARHLARAALERLSGIVTARRGKLKRLFCIEGGGVAHAISNLIEEQLSEFLVQRGILTAGDRAAAAREAERQNLPLTRLLITEGLVSEDVLQRALEQHARELLFSTLEWPDGEVEFESGRPDLGEEIRLGLSCVCLLRQFALRYPESLDEVRVRIGPPNLRPAVAEQRAGLLDGEEFGEAGNYLMRRSDGARTVTELIEASPAADEDSWRALYGLTLLGVLAPASQIRDWVPAGTEEVLEDEVRARLDRSEGADYYRVLELPDTAVRDEIRDAYYFLARRYHPDRFRTGDLQHLFARIEEYFTHVTEAYNTLYDEERRAEYDRQLAEAAPRQAEPDQDASYLARQNFNRAMTLIERGRYTDAAKFLENAIQLDESNATYHLELGRLLARNPRYRAEAERLLIRTNEIDPTLYDGYLELGRLYRKINRQPEAISLLREVLRWEPGHVDATVELREMGEKA